MKNIGWLFYKNYYDFDSLNRSIRDRQPDKTEEGITIDFFNKRNETIFNSEFVPTKEFEVDTAIKISLQTTYPGLLSGSGVTHETGKKSELKLGFSFDHTTGLPYLAGSTVKGTLRQVFPNHLRKKALKIDDPIERKKVFEKADALEKYCCDYLFAEILKIPITPIQLFQIEWKIFEGKIIENIDELLILFSKIEENSTSVSEPDDNRDKVFLAIKKLYSKIEEKSIPVYESDIFHDAFIEESKYNGNLFLDNDFITPHLKPLKNPIPVQFLKVLPKVNWAFQFDLRTTKIDDKLTISNTQKLAIFKQILLDFGIGAKTNVGYGQFINTLTLNQNGNLDKSN